MGNPYLSIGPFLLENKNTEGNYVAQIHNIVSPTEMEAIKAKTQARLKATPYSVGNKQLDFSYDRTSKIHYLSERTDNLTGKLTKRLELAMAFNIYLPDRRYTSENYQIMNYGIGGKIGLHLDTSDTPSDNGLGGGRFTTAMLYLSTVEAGGRTIFPKLLLSVKPEAGSLLYWHLRWIYGLEDLGIVGTLFFSGERIVRWTRGCTTLAARCCLGTSGSGTSGCAGRSRLVLQLNSQCKASYLFSF